jgi:hypothetical protein
VTSIGYYAFYNCGGLMTVTIGNSVSSIGEYAFYNCYRLVEVYNLSPFINLEQASYLNGNLNHYAIAVYTSTDTASKVWTDDDGYIFYEDGDDCYLLGYLGSETTLTLPENCNEKHYAINSNAFRECRSITSITIPDSVTSIGDHAFYQCSDLTRVTIGNSVTNIGDYAFEDCSSLTNIVILDSLTSIGERAFCHCKSLMSITIPDRVTSIGIHAFYDCGSLKTLYYGGTAADWSQISIDSYNVAFTAATRYYYSETQPTTTGNYWHYVDGVPTAWEN